MIWIADAHRDDGKRFVAVASVNRSTACCNARMAARRRSHRPVPLIEDDRALELRGTRARHPGPRRHKAPTARASHAAQLSAPALHLPTPTGDGLSGVTGDDGLSGATGVPVALPDGLPVARAINPWAMPEAST